MNPYTSIVLHQVSFPSVSLGSARLLQLLREIKEYIHVSSYQLGVRNVKTCEGWAVRMTSGR